MTIISRRKYDHPALATAGGSGLHASIENLYTVLGNDSMSRYAAFSAINNSTVAVVAHEFGLDFANLKVQIFTGTYPALTLVSDPIGTGWTVAATSGLASRSIDVTAPASGGPHTYAVLVSHESNATAFIPGLVSIGAQSFAGPKTFLSPILSSLGSVSLPGYSFTGDPNTGMWSSAADTLSFSAGGVKGLEISSIGANNFGPTTGLGTTGSAYHSIYGSIVGAYATGANRFLVVNDTGVVISANQYRDGAGTVKSVSTLTGITTLAILRQSSGTSNVFNLQANYLDAQTANSTSLETNTFSILSVTAAGTCTLGPAAGSVGHIINGQDGNPASFSGSVNINAQSTAANQMSLRLGTYTTGDYSWIQSLQTTTGNPKPLRFYSATVVAGSYDTAGAWTLGPSSGLTAQHIIRSASGSGQLDLQGTAAASRLGLTITNSASSIKGYIVVAGSSNDLITGDVLNDLNISFTGSNLNFGATTALVGKVTSAGAWTLGPATGDNLTTTHIVKSGDASSGGAGSRSVTILRADCVAGSPSTAALVVGNTTSQAGIIHERGSQNHIWTRDTLNFTYTSSATIQNPISGMTGYLNLGSVSTAGAWTLGSLTDTGGLTVNASGGQPLTLASASSTNRITLKYSSTTIGGYMGVSATGLDFLNSTSDYTFRVSDAGACTLGPDSGYTIVHKSFGTWDHKTAASVGVGAIYRSAAALTSGQSHEAVQIYDNTTYKGGFGVAKTTNTSNQAGFLALVTNDGTVCYLWCDDTGRLRISTTQANTGGQATGTVVGTQT